MSNQNVSSKNLGIGCLSTILLIFACTAIIVFMPDNKAGQASKICARAIEHGYNCDSKDLLNNHRAELDYCVRTEDHTANDEMLDFAIICLDTQGVDLVP